MGKFNLNNAADFARATNSFGGSILQQFSGRGASAWILEEGAYRSGVNPDNEVITLRKNKNITRKLFRSFALKKNYVSFFNIYIEIVSFF